MQIDSKKARRQKKLHFTVKLKANHAFFTQCVSLCVCVLTQANSLALPPGRELLKRWWKANTAGQGNET